MKNMLNMLKQAQEMKSNFAKLKQNIENTFFFGESSDGFVKVKVNGKGLLVDLSILYEDNNSMAQVEESVKYAYSDAKKRSDEFCESEMNKATGGMSLPFDMKSFL